MEKIVTHAAGKRPPVTNRLPVDRPTRMPLSRCRTAESLLAPFHFDAVIADKGYDSHPLRDLLAAQQVEVVIPSRRYHKQPRDYDRIRYREPNIVERFINKTEW